MEKAYLCPTCGASVILNGETDPACCFCKSALSEENEIAQPEGGFYAAGPVSSEVRRLTCYKCGKSMLSSPSADLKTPRCLCCGSDDLTVTSEKVMLPSKLTVVPFSCDRKEAEEEYLKAVKKEKIKFHSFSSKEYIDAITPVYVPFFFYDYHAFGSAVLSVVPYVKQPRNVTEKILGVMLLNDFTLERTSNVATPYPKTFSAEMAWRSLPMSASSAIDQKRMDAVSPFLKAGVGTDEREIGEIKHAMILDIDRSAKDIEDEFKARIKDFVKECIITENLENFSITSFIDNTVYDPSLGQLIYVPMWILKVRKKDNCLTWCMNAISGKASDISRDVLDEKETAKEEKTDSLSAISKKRIKSITLDDLGGAEKPVNYRTFMIDIVASAITSEMALNEMSADKSLLQLERNARRKTTHINVPVADAFQPEAEKAVAESKKQPIPSAPVPLPSKHSELYLMKEEARNRSLGRGQRLPEKPLDRRVGNEEEFKVDDTPSGIAVEFGLSDLPEYDPAGPNPFKKV